jgi:hypothetical protein
MGSMAITNNNGIMDKVLSVFALGGIISRLLGAGACSISNF